MDLKWLEDFVSLAETRSFSRSAEERHVTQPAFSRRIQALEMWLGAPLIDRTTYPTTLTESGRRFRETAEEIIQLLGTARADLTAESRTRRRSVSMAALHTLALTFFPRWFGKIEEENRLHRQPSARRRFPQLPAGDCGKRLRLPAHVSPSVCAGHARSVEVSVSGRRHRCTRGRAQSAPARRVVAVSRLREQFLSRTRRDVCASDVRTGVGDRAHQRETRWPKHSSSWRSKVTVLHGFHAVSSKSNSSAEIW